MHVGKGEGPHLKGAVQEHKLHPALERLAHGADAHAERLVVRGVVGGEGG